MSVDGRNHVLGSTLTVYRPTKAAGTGGQTTISWAPVLTAIKWELHTLTAETLRLVFGTAENIERVAFMKQDVDVREQDGIVVTMGRYTGDTYRVEKTRRSRKYLEVALQKTTETIP